MLAALVGALLLAACGSDDSSNMASPPPVAKAQDFPQPKGRTLADLQRELGGAAAGPVLSPAVSQLEPGSNRFAFGLFDRARAQIADAPTVIYVAPVGGGPARGPYPAHYGSLAVEAPFRSQTVQQDKNSAKSVYVANLRFKSQGRYEILGVARLDDRLVAATPAGPPLTVTARSAVPDVGERAPKIHTPTKADVSGDLSKIDTRSPHDDMHDADFADVVGKKPAVLLFATPLLCQSRVCGPVVDIAEQVKSKVKGVTFIHMEIYNGNAVEKGFRPQVLAYHLPTEPWVFVIDRRGRIVARIEGAYSAAELEQAVRRALG